MLGAVLELNDVRGMLLALKERNLVKEVNIKQINWVKVNEGKEPGSLGKN